MNHAESSLGFQSACKGEHVLLFLQSSCVVSAQIQPQMWKKDRVVNHVRFVSPDAALKCYVVCFETDKAACYTRHVRGQESQNTKMAQSN